jgi:hypothetical protein
MAIYTKVVFHMIVDTSTKLNNIVLDIKFTERNWKKEDVAAYYLCFSSRILPTPAGTLSPFIIGLISVF